MKYAKRILPALVVLAGALSCAVPSTASAASVCKRENGLSDNDAIAGVLARYAHYADAKDDAAFAGLFTVDGVWEAAGVGRFAGTDQIRQFIRNAPRGGRHFTSDYVIDVAGTTATARSHVLLIMFDDQRPVVRGIGSYEDELVCTDGGWKIKSRKFVPAAPAPPPTQ